MSFSVEWQLNFIELNLNFIELKLNFIELKLNYGIEYCYNRLAIDIRIVTPLTGFCLVSCMVKVLSDGCNEQIHHTISWNST